MSSVAAFRTLRPVSNRLEVVEDARHHVDSRRLQLEPVRLPRGARSGGGAAGERDAFLVTPGVIELGATQFDGQHGAVARGGRRLRQHDRRLRHEPRRRSSPGTATPVATSGSSSVANRTEAFRWLTAHVTAGDLVMLENDLPDLYERRRRVLASAIGGSERA